MVPLNKGFSIGEAVKFGWRATRSHLLFVFGFMVAVGILQAVPPMIQAFFQPTPELVVILTGILSVIISVLMAIASVKFGLMLSDNQPVRFSDLGSIFPLIFKFFVASILYMLIVLGGFLLLVFPMVIWGLRYSLFPYFIVDKGVGPLEALRLSAKATKGAKWDLLGLFFVGIIINFLGALCLLIGLFITLPTMWIANALVYRYLVKQTAGVIP